MFLQTSARLFIVMLVTIILSGCGLPEPCPFPEGVIYEKVFTPKVEAGKAMAGVPSSKRERAERYILRLKHFCDIHAITEYKELSVSEATYEHSEVGMVYIFDRDKE